MPCKIDVVCPKCGENKVVTCGKEATGKQRYRCKNDACDKQTFLLNYHNKACQEGMKKTIIEMAINGSGIRDTARVLGIDKGTVIRTLKKK